MSVDPTSPNEKQTVIVMQTPGSGLGIASLVFGLLAFFVLAILFGPLSLIFGAIGLTKGQYVWSIAGILVAVIAMMTSPIIWGIIGISAINAGM